MLPGFRFLFAAILLSISVLVFALGAAALLRATHEQFANNPSWRTGPQEQVFAQAPAPAQPVLAALRLDLEPSEPATSIRDQVPTIGLPEREPEQVAVPEPQAAADATTQEADASRIQTQPSEPTQTALAADTPVAAAPPAEPETTAAGPDNKAAASEVASPAPAPAAPSETQQAVAAVITAPAGTDDATTKAAALGDPAAAGKEPPADAKTNAKTTAKTNAKATSDATEKAGQKRAHRAKKKRRIVRRPPQPPVQQSYDPFATQPTFATTTTAARTR